MVNKIKNFFCNERPFDQHFFPSKTWVWIRTLIRIGSGLDLDLAKPEYDLGFSKFGSEALVFFLLGAGDGVFDCQLRLFRNWQKNWSAEERAHFVQLLSSQQ
jgi:hypothetical protein